MELNRIILSDCFNFLSDVPDNYIDLIIIDPPYLTTKEKWDKSEVVNNLLSQELFRVAKDSCSLYVWCGIGEKSQSLIRWFPIFSKNWYFKDLITWGKQRGMGMRRGWVYTREECMWFVKDNKNFIWNKDFQYSNERRKRDGGKDIIKVSQNGKFAKNLYKRITNVWTDITEQTFDVINFKGHYTPKPEKLIERIISVHSKQNDLILDCFMGSGTTGYVARKMNRNFIGCDNNQEFVDLANKRIKEYL